MRSELPDILQTAELSDAKKSFMWFALDICLDLDLWAESLRILKKIAVRFDVSDIDRNNMAFYVTSAGDNKAAIAHYRKSLKLKLENSSSARGLAPRLHEMGRYEKSRDIRNHANTQFGRERCVPRMRKPSLIAELESLQA